MSRGSKVAIRIEMHPNGVHIIDNVGGQALWGGVNEFDVIWSPAPFDPRAECFLVLKLTVCPKYSFFFKILAIVELHQR